MTCRLWICIKSWMLALEKIIYSEKNLGFERVHKWCDAPVALFSWQILQNLQIANVASETKVTVQCMYIIM